MANRTIQFDIKAFADTKGLDEFAAQLKELNGTAQASDRVLGQAVKVVNEWAKSQKLSADNTASVVSAINALKGAMTAGSTAWKAATQSAGQHTKALKDVTNAAMAAKAALESPAGTTSGAGKQISAMRAGLADLNIQGERYVSLLAQINEREALLGRRTGRAGVIAGQQAYAGGMMTAGYGAAENLAAMPDTGAALRQRMSELNQELPNLIRGSEQYFRVAREMSEIERELKRDLTGTTQALRQRSAATQSKIDAVRAYNRDATADRVAAGIDSVAARRGTAFGDVPQVFQQPGGGFIAPPATGGRYGTNFNQYSSPIGPVDARSQLANKQAADTQLRSAHERHRQQLLQIDEKYNQLEIQKDNEAHKKMLAQQQAAFNADIADFDRRLEARDRRRNRRQGGNRFGAFGQSAGAIAAGGFFGGPEGIIGGLAGTAIAGPAGALAGATAGASVGAFRKQLGGISEYTAQLNLAKITLAQVSAGLDDYNRKLEFARTVSGNYAVDLETSIKGYARITAAAQANNLSLADTQAIYKGLISTGVAFGSSQEDLQAIVTATVQVLSKGKLSAEELSGQLGERIPGAVAAFAQATGRSLPELAAALKKGEVTIADFVKFAKVQVDKYDEIAQIIGASPEKAGARLKLALDTAAENYGGFLQQIGAGFQDNMTKVVAWFNENEVIVKNWVTLFYNGASRIGRILETLVRNAIRSYQIASEIMSRTPGGIIGGIIGNVAERIGIGSNSGKALPDWINQGGKTPDQLFPSFTPINGMFGAANGAANNLGNPAAEAEDDTAAKNKAANEAAAKERLAMQLYNDQLRLEERLAQNRIKLEDTVFRHRMDLMRRTAENQQELDDKRMQNLLGRMTGDTSGAAAVVDLVRGLQELDRRKVDAQQGILQAQRDLTSARQSAAATARTESLLRSDEGGAGMMGGSAQGVYRQGGYGPRGRNQYGDHHDIKRADGRYFPRNALDRYVLADGRPLSSGVTVPGGQFGASRDGGSRVHNAWDYAFPRGRGDLTLTGGAKWVSSKRGSYGDNTAFQTPDGTVYRIIHGTFSGSASATTTLANGKTTRIPGLTGAAGRNINDDGSVMTSEAEVAQQRELLRLETERAKLLRPELIAEFTNKISGGLREQQKALEESNAEFQLRNRLTMEGMRPDQIDFEVNKARIFRDSTEAVSQANEVLEQLKDRISPEVYKEAKDAIEQLGEGYRKLAADTEAAYKAQNAPGVKLNRRRGELRQALGELGETENAIISLSESVENGFSNGFSSAVTNIVSGTGTIKDAIANMLQSIAQEFLNYAAKILAKQAVLGILGLFGRGIGGIGGGIGGGGLASAFSGGSNFSAGFGMAGSLLANGGAFSNGIRPFASGGVVDRPTLFKFANGGAMQTGLMGEAGPEAILPLRRGPNGKLGVQAAPAAPIDVRVETTVINGVEYATVDQLRQATKDAAVRGRNMAYAGIQQSTKVRRRLGV
jgi:tape measure domain-containing protein